MLPIEILEQKPFYLGSWLVNPAKNTIKNKDINKTVQPKLMEVLTYLSSKQGKIVNSDELIKQCWPHQYISDNPIHKCIAQLRKALGDSSKNPKYIATIPKRGYSVIAHVSTTQNSGSSIEPFWLNKAPFRGLKQYRQEHKDIFFGRSQAIIDILSLINSKASGSTTLIMLLGQSGCGKSSLVQAGLLPKLLHPYKPFKNHYVASYDFVPNANNEYNNVQNFLTFLCENGILDDQKTTSEYAQLLIEDSNKLLDYVNPKSLENNPTDNGQLIIFIDQLEYVFTSESSGDIINQFFHLIELLMLSKKCLVISALRNEYYQELTETSAYLKIRSSAFHYDIPPLNYDEICDIIRKPVLAAGLKFEIDSKTHVPLDTYLINMAQAIQASLPILQYTLWNLYQNKQEKELTYEVYQNNGGMEGGLSIMAENLFQELSPSSQSRFEELLHNLIQINPQAKNAIRCKKASMKLFTDHDSKTVIERFIDKRLFKTEWVDDEPYLSITHDILINSWKRLSDWVSKNTSLLNSRHELTVATDQWLHHDKSKDFLLIAEQPLRSANVIADNGRINLTDDEKTFIHSSNTRFNFSKRLKQGLIASLMVSMFLSSFLAISIYSKNKQITATKNNAENLISFILFDLKDKLTPLGRIDLLDLVGTKTIDYFANIGTKELTGKSLLHWIEALHIVGEVSFTKGDYQQSYGNFEKSHDILLTALENNSDDSVLLEKHMLNNYWLGYINVIKKDYGLADHYLQQYLKSAKILSDREPELSKWQLELSYALNNLGTLAIKTKQLGLAHQYFSDSIVIKERLLADEPQNQLLIADLADSVSWLGKIKQQEGDLRAKLKINQQSLELSRELVAINPSKPQWQHRLSIALHRVALVHYDFAELIASKELISESIQLMELLVDNDADNYTYKKELINNYLLMAKINRHQKNLDKSLFYIQKGQVLIDLFKTQLKFNEKIARYNVNFIVEQANIMVALNQQDIALETLDGATNIWNDYLQGKSQSENDEAASMSLALINLTKINTLKTMQHNSEAMQNKLLKVIDISLMPLIGKQSTNFRAIAMYLQLHRQHNHDGMPDGLNEILKESEYQNPDFDLTGYFNNLENTFSQK